jgi:putative MATE family efflux protein
MLVLALPVLAEESLNLAVGYTDWFLAGRMLPGEEPKAAMGLMAYVMWLLPSLFSFVSIGATALVARFVGARDFRNATHATTQALLLGAGLAVVGIVLTVALAGPFVHAMQLRGETAALALRYIRIVTWGIPAIMLEYVGTACLRGAGDTVSGLVARVVLNLVNIVLSISLVAGLWFFPKLGWDGIAIGTTVGHWCAGIIILALLLRGRAGLRAFSGARLVQFDTELMRRMLRVGMPGGIDVLSIIGCHLAYLAIINSLGTVAQAAHGLGVRIEALSYLPGSAFQVAAATLAGQSLGAANPRQAMRSVLASLLVAVVIMSAAGVVFFFWGEQLAMIFTGDQSAITELTGRLLKIVACATPVLAVLMVLTGALRGAGDTRWMLAITFVGLVGVRLPLACFLALSEIPIPLMGVVLPGVGLGVIGAWYAMAIDCTVRATLAAVRFRQGGWKGVRV